MPIPEAPLRVFRTFICIKRIPLPPSLFYCVPLSSPLPFSSCLLLATQPTSASFYIRYLKALPLSVLPAVLSRLSTRTLVVSLLYVLLPLFIIPFNPTPCPLSPYTAYLPFVFLRGTRMLPLYARISLLNLVHQVTILLLSPFSPRYFSCRYSTLLLFLVNAFVFVTRRTSSDTSPLFFCIR